MQLKFLSFCILLAFSLNAQPVSMCVESQAPVVKECPRKCESPKKTGEAFKPSILEVKNACNGSFFLEALYWKAVTTDWILGIEYIDTADREIPLGSYIHEEIGWGPGGRMGINFSGIYDWTIGLIGTYYHNNKSIHYTDKILYTNIRSENLKSKAKTTYYTIDLNFSTHFNITKTISFAPLMGAKAVYIKNKYLHHVIGENIDTHIPNDIKFTTIVKYLGFGPQVGTTGFLKFGTSDFDFFSSVDLSLVYGKNSCMMDFVAYIGSPSAFNLPDHFNSLKAFLQLVAGIEWKHHFAETNYNLGLQVSYEANLWWDIGNRLFVIGNPAFLNNTTGSNYTLHGGNFSLTFDF